jgi:hypothetical protein
VPLCARTHEGRFPNDIAPHQPVLDLQAFHVASCERRNG